MSVAAPTPQLVGVDVPARYGEEAAWLTRRVARTFSLSCLLLPRRLRRDVQLLYMVLRRIDDLVDRGDPLAAERIAAVESWVAGEGGEGGREERILSYLFEHYDLSREAVGDFCLGMRMDLDQVEIETEEELDLYAYRVAGTVGRLMAGLLEVDDPRAAERSAPALGVAMQRTNILRDIAEDASQGRVYLARETLERFSVEDLGRDDLEPLLRDQIARAEACYEVGMAGIPHLRHGRRAIATAGAMYREILRQIEREGYGRSRRRAVVPVRRKLVVATRAATAAREPA